MCLQPVMIPVGKIALSQIPKATGTAIDEHVSLSPTGVHSNINSSMYFVSGSTLQPEVYTARYSNNIPP